MIRVSREEVLTGYTRRIKTGCGNLYITVNTTAEGKPIEVFVRLGKAGGCASCQSEALGRLITIALRSDVKIDRIVQQLMGIGCHQPVGFGPTKVLSCADAVAKVLREPVLIPAPEEDTKSAPLEVVVAADIPLEEEVIAADHEKVFVEIDRIIRLTKSGACPDCGATLAFEEGCEKCFACGYTKCH